MFIKDRQRVGMVSPFSDAQCIINPRNVIYVSVFAHAPVALAARGKKPRRVRRSIRNMTHAFFTCKLERIGHGEIADSDFVKDRQSEISPKI